MMVTGTLADFCQMASEKIGLIVEMIERKATRISVVQIGFLPDEFLEPANDLGRKMLSVVPVFKEKTLHEWNYQVCVRFDKTFGSKTELTNSIITLSRNTVTLQKTSDNSTLRVKEVVHGSIDINTIPENTEDRFTSEDVSSFFRLAPEWHNELTSDATSYFTERE